MLFDNSGIIPMLIAKGKNGKLEIMDENSYESIIKGIDDI
jgi:hypothetical protein